MINSYLSGVSPQKPSVRRLQSLSNSLIHLTCHQITQLKINYDDVILDGFCVQIISCKQELSPQKKLIKVLNVKDSSGVVLRCIQVYHGHDFWGQIQKLIKSREYVCISMDGKCSGLYRFEIKFTVNSMKRVEDFNEIQLHMSQVMRDYIEAKSKQ